MQLGGSAVTKPGYRFGAQFLKPDFLARDQQLELDLTALKQSLKAYDQTALIEKVAAHPQVLAALDRQRGLAGEQERITQQGMETPLQPARRAIVARYDSTNSQLDPTRASARASASRRPSRWAATALRSSSCRHPARPTSTSADGGRSVVALRGLVGRPPAPACSACRPTSASMPAAAARCEATATRRSVRSSLTKADRGHRDLRRNHRVRQRILGNYGVVGFVDAGQVSTNGAPFTSNWRAGAGAGFAIHLHRANPAGHRRAAEQAAGGRFARTVSRPRAGILNAPGRQVAGLDS